MTRTIFLVTGIVLTALAVAAPSALGQGRNGYEHGQGRPYTFPAQVAGVEYFYANERATIPFPPVVHDHGDATQAKLLVQSPSIEVIRDHGDATQAKLTLSDPVVAPVIVRDHGDATQAKLSAQSSGTPSVGEVESTSGWELDWSQLAIGFGVGMVLVLGLMLGVQLARSQRLAH